MSIVAAKVTLDTNVYVSAFQFGGMRRYGWVREIKDPTPEGYFRYGAVQKEPRP